MRRSGIALLAGTLLAGDARAEGPVAEPSVVDKMNAALDAGDADAAFEHCGGEEVEDVAKVCDVIRENYVVLKDYPYDGRRDDRNKKDIGNNRSIASFQAAGWYRDVADSKHSSLGSDRANANYRHVKGVFNTPGPQSTMVAKSLLQAFAWEKDEKGESAVSKERLEGGYSFFYKGVEYPLYCKEDAELGLEVCELNPSRGSYVPTDYSAPKWTFHAGPSFALGLEQDAYGEVDGTGAGVNAAVRFLPETFGAEAFLQTQFDQSAQVDGFLDRFGVMGVGQHEFNQYLSLGGALGPAVNASRMYAAEFGFRAQVGAEFGVPVVDRLFQFGVNAYLDTFFDRGVGSPLDQVGVKFSAQLPVEWRQ